MLYVSALSAVQYKAKIKSTYERLVVAGKSKKVVIVGCMCRLLTIQKTMMKNGTHWDKKFA